MARKIEIELYNFEELSEKAQQRAIEDYRNIMEIDSQAITETFNEFCVDMGFDPSVKCYWSISSSQGDGVAIEGHIKDVEKFLKAKFPFSDKGMVISIPKATLDGQPLDKQDLDNISISCKQRGRYFNMDIEVTYLGDVEFDLEAFQEEVKEKLEDLAGFLFEVGEKEIEYQHSEDTIKENIIANEYEFTSDGAIH